MSAPVFGKRRNTALARIPAPAPSAADDLTKLPPAYASFFAVARRQIDDADDIERPREVPLSGRAAILSGLVVGCALAGFDATGNNFGAATTIANMLGLASSRAYLVPGLIVLGVIGGARLTAITVVVVHNVLRAMAQIGFAAYALGGMLASVAQAVAISIALGHPPGHGWVAELAAGAASGLLYRAFAGTKQV